MGTMLQARGVPWNASFDLLNLTHPDLVAGIHRDYAAAGAQVVETNTFGASRVVLAEYGLEERVREINEAAVAHARKAMAGLPNRFVAGSVGPTTKLPSLGHISRDELFAAVQEQVEALLSAGVDLLLFETCQDLLQLKTCLIAAHETFERASKSVPVMASVTVERTGTLLVGTDIAAAAVALEPLPLFSLGLNCATGPADMESHIRYLSQQWSGRISCMPNQGLPEVIGGQTVYPLSPAEYARHMRHLVEAYGVSVVGGCCGTSPEHIRALAGELRGVSPAQRSVET
jgi:5-methyltetrahydrofolate--homocysteine methyltransferase